MKKIALLLVAIAMITWSCNEKANAPAASDVLVSRREMKSEVIKTVANLSIEGMTCSEGCGGKIQQDLRALKGVVNTELDFAENRPANVVSVEYNPGLLTEADLINCVNGIGDGQYHVKAVEILSYKGLQSSGSGNGADVTDNNFGRVFQLLNLLQSVSKMIE